MTSSVSAAAGEVAERQQRDWVLIALWLTLAIVALIWIAPFIFIVFTSLKSNAAVIRPNTVTVHTRCSISCRAAVSNATAKRSYLFLTATSIRQMIS